MNGKTAALILAALALGGCSGHSDQALRLTLTSLDLECLHTEMLYADLAKFHQTFPRVASLNRGDETAGRSPEELRAMTGEVVQIFSKSPGRHEELARVAHELFIVTGKAQAAMKSGDPRASSQAKVAAAAVAIRRMRELQARLSFLAPAGILESLPRA